MRVDKDKLHALLKEKISSRPLQQYWCWNCGQARLHVMETEEKGSCSQCGKTTWAPTGDVG